MSANPLLSTDRDSAAEPVTEPAAVAGQYAPGGLRGAIKRIILFLLPQHAWAELRFELHMMRVRLGSRTAARRFRYAKDLLVNLGAGTQGKAGWVNLDAFFSRGSPALTTCAAACRLRMKACAGFFASTSLNISTITRERPCCCGSATVCCNRAV